jgi:hypothetical protein
MISQVVFYMAYFTETRRIFFIWVKIIKTNREQAIPIRKQHEEHHPYLPTHNVPNAIITLFDSIRG